MERNDMSTDNQELFDRYIEGTMSEDERVAFEKRLNDDAALRKEYLLYAAIIDGIEEEERQDCMDFAVAMKHLTSEDVAAVVGRRAAVEAEEAFALHETHMFHFTCPTPRASAEHIDSDSFEVDEPVSTVEKKEKRSRRCRRTQCIRPVPTVEKKEKHSGRILWIAALAAVIIVLVIFAGNMYSDYRDIEVYSKYIYYDKTVSRGVADDIPIYKMSDDELAKELPSLKERYDTSTSAQDIAVNGRRLALAYLRLHERAKARDVLNEVIGKLSQPAYSDDWAEVVAELQSMLDDLK